MKRLPHKKKFTLITIVLCLGIVVVAAVWFFYPDKKLTDKQQMEKVRNTVAKLILLPSGEDPTLATVTDKKSLTDSFLSANAETGDKVLVYYKTRKIFIYRPSAKKLVATGPLTIDPSASEVSGTRIKVRAGSTDPAAVSKIHDILAQNYKSAVVGESDSSTRLDYPSTIVIDLTDGEKYDFVTNIMQVIGASRGILPAGETAPEDTDILIITGVK